MYKSPMTSHRPVARMGLFLALLLWAQASFAAHTVDAAAHAVGEQCEWCVAGGSLTGAVPAMAPVALAPGVQAMSPTVPMAPVAEDVFAHYLSRAPPQFFS